MNDQPKKATSKPNYAFIDGQNLNMGIKKAGWTLDYSKFRRYLRDKYNVEKAYFFIGLVMDQEDLYNNLHKWGYQVVFKPTVESGDNPVKGNVDAELVLHTLIEMPNYNKALIVSGDGDFYCLAEYLVRQHKLLKILVPNRNFSSLLKNFESYLVRIDVMKRFLNYRRAPRSKPAEAPPEEKTS